MRLIDADKLYDKLIHDTLTVYDANDREYIVKLHVATAIEDAPAVDAVEVVRCKDCKHSDIWGLEKSLGGDPRDTRVCLCGNRPHWTRDDDFCSCGKRRDHV